MKRSGDRVIARDRVIGNPASPCYPERARVPASANTSTAVILSGAPRQNSPYVTEGREVEGPLRCLISPCGNKAFSGELPDAALVMQESSGSFDSPSSRSAEPGLAQDDSGRPFRGILKIVTAALREIFDESAYDRFLLRTQTLRSVESYREFMRERETAVARKPRCC